MTLKLLTEHHLEFLSLNGGCTGLSESIHVKMPHCWKSYVAAHMHVYVIAYFSTQNAKCTLSLMLILCTFSLQNSFRNNFE